MSDKEIEKTETNEVDQAMMDSLNPEIRRLMLETNTNITDPRDIEALANVSVRELTKLFDNIAEGMTKEQALFNLRDEAVKKLEEKKRRENIIKEETHKMEALLKEIEDYGPSQLQELVDQKQDELNSKKNGDKDAEDMFPELLQLKEEELNAIKNILSEKLDEEERKEAERRKQENLEREQKEKERAEALQQFVKKAVDAAEQESSTQIRVRISAMQSEIADAMDDDGQDGNDMVERLKEAIKALEEIEEKKIQEEEAKRVEQLDALKTEVDDLPDESLEKRIEEKRQALEKMKGVEAEDESTSIDSKELEFVEQELQILEEALKKRIEEAEKELQKAQEVEDQVAADMAEMSTGSQKDSPSSAVDETEENDDDDDDDSDDDGESDSFVPEGFEAEDAKAAAELAENTDEYRYSVDDLDEKKWLKWRFDVRKYDPRSRLLSRKKRTWEIDFFGNRFNNMSRKGKIKKSLKPKNLFQLQRVPTDNRRILMRFFGSRHSYELVFKTNELRERFFECASAIRPSHFSWCPDLCKPGVLKSRTVLHGRFTTKIKGSKTTETGECSINVTSDPYDQIRTFCGTWNMGKNAPPKDPQFLRQFVPPNEFDIYAIGVEESGFKGVEGFKSYIQEVLGEDYVLVASQSLWEIKLVVFVKKRHFTKISNVESQTKATGFMNMLGNKGAVSVGLRFNETNILFVNSHLASNKKGKGDVDTSAESCKARNQSVHEIIDSFKYRNRELDFYNQFHYVFFMGDLNYRVGMPFDDAVMMSKFENYRELVKNDQLRQHMTMGNLLVDFQEAEIDFPPTYKYVVGTNEFLQDSKKSTPSYTDRVLWKALPGSEISCDEYGGCSTLNTSDQIPVYAHFTMNTIRPYLSVFSKQEPTKILVIEEATVSGRNDPISKPSLTFYADFLHSSESTLKIGGKKANPKWIMRQLPSLRFSTSNRDFLRHQYIIVALRDGSAKGENIDNLIGTAAVPLREVVDKMPHSYEYELTMHRQGVKACNIMIRMHLME